MPRSAAAGGRRGRAATAEPATELGTAGTPGGAVAHLGRPSHARRPHGASECATIDDAAGPWAASHASSGASLMVGTRRATCASSSGSSDSIAARATASSSSRSSSSRLGAAIVAKLASACGLAWRAAWQAGSSAFLAQAFDQFCAFAARTSVWRRREQSKVAPFEHSRSRLRRPHAIWRANPRREERSSRSSSIAPSETYAASDLPATGTRRQSRPHPGSSRWSPAGPLPDTRP